MNKNTNQRVNLLILFYIIEKFLDKVKIIRNVPILEISFYKVLPDKDVSTLYGYQPALSNEVFERVKINVSALLRKHKKMTESGYGGRNMARPARRSGRPNRTAARYKPGFRGRGRGIGGQRNGPRYAPGFRGRAKTGKGGFGFYHSKFDPNAPAFKPRDHNN